MSLTIKPTGNGEFDIEVSVVCCSKEQINWLINWLANNRDQLWPEPSPVKTETAKVLKLVPGGKDGEKKTDES